MGLKHLVEAGLLLKKVGADQLDAGASLKSLPMFTIEVGFFSGNGYNATSPFLSFVANVFAFELVC